jgi:UDP-glucose-4-epimerase GalE
MELSTADPAKYHDNNVGGTAKLLQACAAFGCKSVVFSGFCATYGVPERLPLTEDAAQNPVNLYGYTRLVVERMLRDVEGGNRHVALRFFNPAGADPDGDLGKLHQPETHLTSAGAVCGDGAGAIKIFGHDYPTPAGTSIRDYVHISDLADAHVAAIEWVAGGQSSTSFNLGNGRAFSAAEVIKIVPQLTANPVPVEICPRRPGDLTVLVSDSSKARELLRWSPRFPDLDEQITHAWAWFRDKMRRPPCTPQ